MYNVFRSLYGVESPKGFSEFKFQKSQVIVRDQIIIIFSNKGREDNMIEWFVNNERLVDSNDAVIIENQEIIEYL